MSALHWDNYHGIGDPRIRVAVLLAIFLTIGIAFLGINKTPEQVGFILLVGCATDMLLHRILRPGRGILFPMSAVITCLGLSILTNFAHTIWLGAIPIFFAIGSKYLITAEGKHIFNPGLFGLVACLLWADGLISPASASQWGGQAVMVFFFIFTALSIFLFNISRVALTCSFLLFYGLQLYLRSYVLDTTIPPLALVDGVLRNPAFYLFTFFMLTDPKTSPHGWKGQMGMALAVVCFDFLLHMAQFTFTLFYAGALYFALRWMWLQQKQTLETIPKRLLAQGKPAAVIFCLAIGAYTLYQTLIVSNMPTNSPATSFTFDEIPFKQTGISAHPGTLLSSQVDPRIQHVGKWFFSMGDAVAVSDVNQDGLPDIFLTLPLKANEDRAQLYLNQGGFRFTKHPIPALNTLRQNPTSEGVPMDALWFDEDNDGDKDLLLVRYGGTPILLQNQLVETGTLDFTNITQTRGLNHYLNSATANVLDINRDGQLDLIIGGTLSAHHLDYDEDVPLNLFALPKAENASDKRPINIMRRNPFDARNGGENRIFLHNGEGFNIQDNAAWGIEDSHRWTLDIGTGDVNNDGWIDLYFANTAGPDKLLINMQGKAFSEISGWKKHQLGKDTYRGMNASFADFNADGFEDIYVSNMHKKEVPEGSMLWINQGSLMPDAANFVDQAFASNIFNHGRFGWGAAVGDLNRDGTLDVLQMNGWLDNAYDENPKAQCADYVYKMFQVEFTPPNTHGYADNWPDMRGECIYPKEAKRVWLNDGNANFIDVAETVGWDTLDNSKGVALADFDNDGDLDAIVTRMTHAPSLYKNTQSATPYWLGLHLTGNGQSCNRDAIGTKATLSYRVNGQPKTQTRYVTGSNGLSAQNDPRRLFGFGTEKPEELRLRIHWCGEAAPQELHPITMNRYMNIIHTD
ncbi:MAG: FG-GAP-like repeat-containing protein [Rickettsiales bacterium]|nr:FG-GAP-like repeat-containing protein [Rickettsiales bacterium]